MKIVVTKVLVRDPRILQLATLARELGATRYVRFEGNGTAYGFDLEGEKDIYKAEWEEIMSFRSSGLRVEGSNMYSPIVPRSTLDNKVPNDWPSAYILDEEGSPIRTKTWTEYTQVYDQGSEDCRIAYKGEPIGNNFLRCDDVQLQRWLDKFGGYSCLEEFYEWRISPGEE